jgi:phage-related protein
MASVTLGTGLGSAGAVGAAPVTKTLDGSANLVSSVAPVVSSLGTGGLSGLAPATNAVASVVNNVGTGVGNVVSSPAIAPVTNTLNTVVNNVASATGLSSTTGTGSNTGAGADPVSSLLGRLKDLGKGNHGL